jgi:uncharacterized protein (TIRG00374 family)
MKRIIGIAVSAALLLVLYAIVDFGALLDAMRAADLFWLTVGLLMVIPLTIATAWRFQALVIDAHVGFGEANRLVLAASTLNLFLPSKLGDLAKAFVLSARHGMEGELAFSIVVFEKALDMVSLLLWGAFACLYVGSSKPEFLLFAFPVLLLLGLTLLIILPLPAASTLIRLAARMLPRGLSAKAERLAGTTVGMATWFWQRPRRAAGILFLSILLWGAHLLQFWLFTRAIGGVVPLLDNMAFATLAILVGLLPFTFAGIGSRDAAIVYFYGPYLSLGGAAFLGILATLRYVIPAIAGIPFAGDLAAAAATQRSKAQDLPAPADRGQP